MLQIIPKIIASGCPELILMDWFTFGLLGLLWISSWYNLFDIGVLQRVGRLELIKNIIVGNI